MLPEQAPECLCGTKHWNHGGGTFSHELHSQWFTCNGCGRRALNIGNGGGHAFIISTIDNNAFPNDGLDWIITTLLLVWRDVEERLTLARGVIEQKASDMFCKSENLPQGTQVDAMDHCQKGRFRVLGETLHQDNRWLKPRGFENQAVPPLIPASVTVFHLLSDGKWKMVGGAETTDIKISVDPIRVRRTVYFNHVIVGTRDVQNNRYQDLMLWRIQ